MEPDRTQHMEPDRHVLRVSNGMLGDATCKGKGDGQATASEGSFLFRAFH